MVGGGGGGQKLKHEKGARETHTETAEWCGGGGTKTEIETEMGGWRGGMKERNRNRIMGVVGGGGGDGGVCGEAGGAGCLWGSGGGVLRSVYNG